MALATRLGGCFGLWLVLSGGGAADMPVGILAAGLAAWASLRLLPPAGPARLRLPALAGLVLRFPVQSLAAGIDVARRALAPTLALRPGILAHPWALPPGPARAAFATLSSLLPGSVPAGSDDGATLAVHCLDTGQPVLARLATEEARFARALGHG
ncbi:Sodium:proton antiporter [Rhodovastum atsumiense]|nr:Sodium:proton antiporter [Rhodovastum atsumiense]